MMFIKYYKYLYEYNYTRRIFYPMNIHERRKNKTNKLLNVTSAIVLMHESIPGVTIPPPFREHTRAFDLIGYDSVNARVLGHNLKTNARPLGKLRVENAPPRGRFYSRFHETLTTNVPNFVAKFASSL